jgi:hypothetical protein
MRALAEETAQLTSRGRIRPAAAAAEVLTSVKLEKVRCS